MINASFKVFWNNPIEMVTSTSPQQLEFNLPLGAIIADPNIVVDLSNYDTKAEVDAKIATANSYTDAGVQSSINHTDQGDNALYIFVNNKNNQQDLVTDENRQDAIDRDTQLGSRVDDLIIVVDQNKTSQDNKNLLLDDIDQSLQTQITNNYTTSQNRDNALDDRIDSTNLVVGQNKTDSETRDTNLSLRIDNLTDAVDQNRADQLIKDTAQDNLINTKASISYVDSSNASQDTVIDLKADKTYVDTKNTEQDAVTALKADITYVDSQNTDQNTTIALKANTTYVDSENDAQDLIISTKANTTYVNSQNDAQDLVISTKASTSYVDSANSAQDVVINTKASITYVDGKVQQTITDGVTTSAPSQDAVHDALFVKQNLPTGYLTGWQLSVNTLNNTKFDIATGSGIITDFTDLNGIQPEIKQTLSPLVSLTPQFLLTHPSSYIAFDKDLNVVQSSSPFTNEQRRTLIILGSVIHSNNININVTNEIKAPIVAPTNQIHDFMLAVGAMNLSGNEIIPNGANLAVNITAGTVWKMGVNASNQFNPHQVSFPLRTTPLFTYRLRNSTEYAATTSLDPLNYDLNGVRTALSNNNRWTIQRVYMFQSGLIRLQYGQAEYTTYQNALNALLSEPFATEQNIKDNGLFIARIIIKRTCTNLTADINAGIASIHVTDKFGNSISTAAVTASAIISALGYTPVNPRKTVNSRSNDYTLQASDAGNIVRTTGAGAHNITVPTEASAGWVAQDRVEVQWYGTGQPTIVPASGVVIRVAGGGSLALTQQYSRVMLEYIGTNEWVLFRA